MPYDTDSLGPQPIGPVNYHCLEKVKSIVWIAVQLCDMKDSVDEVIKECISLSKANLDRILLEKLILEERGRIRSENHALAKKGLAMCTCNICMPWDMNYEWVLTTKPEKTKLLDKYLYGHTYEYSRYDPIPQTSSRFLVHEYLGYKVYPEKYRDLCCQKCKTPAPEYVKFSAENSSGHPFIYYCSIDCSLD